MVNFWNCNLRDIKFERNLDFVEVINSHSKVVYCIQTDTLWWRPELGYSRTEPIFRYNLKNFIKEVENEFPMTEVYNSTYDVTIDDELSLVCEYLKFVRKKFKRV